MKNEWIVVMISLHHVLMLSLNHSMPVIDEQIIDIRIR